MILYYGYMDTKDDNVNVLYAVVFSTSPIDGYLYFGNTPVTQIEGLRFTREIDENMPDKCIEVFEKLKDSQFYDALIMEAVYSEQTANAMTRQNQHGQLPTIMPLMMSDGGLQ